MRYGDYFHVAVHDCECSHDDVDSREIDVVTGPGWLVTVRHPSDDGTQVDLDEVARRFELQRTEHSTHRAGLPALGALRRDRRPLLRRRPTRSTNGSTTIEEEVFSDDAADRHPAEIVHACAATSPTFRRAAAPMREVVERDHPQGDRLRRRRGDRALPRHLRPRAARRSTSSSRSATCSPACSRPTSR